MFQKRRDHKGSDSRIEAKDSGELEDRRKSGKGFDKYELIHYNALPEYHRDNEYILNHYRSNWPLKQAFVSLFAVHNETVNIWTHLVGFVFFVCLTIYTFTVLPKVVEMPSLRLSLSMENFHRYREELISCLSQLSSVSNSHVVEMLSNCLPEVFSASNRTDPCVLQKIRHEVLDTIAPLFHMPTTRWPFFLFLGGAMFCLLASTACHLFACHSEQTHYLLMRIDYAGIATLISTSFYPPIYYAFMCYPVWRNVYLSFITIFGVVTITASLLQVFQSPKYRNIRAMLYFSMGFSGAIPLFHNLYLYWDEPVIFQVFLLEVLMGAFYGFGALVYAARIPEKWKPGLFDIIGNSHQLFHVLVVAGAYTHYEAGLTLLHWRDVYGCSVASCSYAGSNRYSSHMIPLIFQKSLA